MRVWITQLRKGLLEFCVLNVLAHGETYGYELTKRLKQLEELSVTESTIYPILTRLREDGLLQIRTAPSPGGPPRRYFSLTPAGYARVQEMNTYWDHLSDVIQQLRRGDMPEGEGHGVSS